MAHALWEGVISFGLVEIPVSLYPAENREELKFRLLDRRDFAPVGYQRINKNTGKEVPWDEIVKGYEVDKDEFVVMSDEELRAANVRASQTVEIIGFVDGASIDPMFFDRPYYVMPARRGGKSYALLRDTLERTGRIGIAKVVIRVRQHLAALRVRGPILVLELMRFAHELRTPEDLDLPVESLSKVKATASEVKLAERLVREMAMPWKPEKYHDEYRDDVLKLVEAKLKAGKSRSIEEPKAERRKTGEAKVVDLMALLKKSLQESEKPRRGPRTASRQSHGHRKAG